MSAGASRLGVVDEAPRPAMPPPPRSTTPSTLASVAVGEAPVNMGNPIMADEKLILHPADPEATPGDARSVLAPLAAAGLVGDPFDFRGAVHYQPGARFAQLLAFVGCSPAVAPTAPGAAALFHVGLTGTDRARFLGGDNVRAPQCPRCRTEIREWRALVAAWESRHAGTWSCPQCGAETPPARLRWRERAGFGRLSLEIWNVPEGIALPSDELLALLDHHTGVRWQHFYYRGPPSSV